MNKAATYSYRGMNQDINKSSFPKEFYFEGKNIRIIATDTQSTGAITNEKGNKFIYQIPIPVIDYENKKITYIGKELPYETEEITAMSSLNPSQSGTQYIIGHTTTRRYVVLLTSDEHGFDCIWKIDLESPTYEITLLYLRTMVFSRDNPIQALNNFENKIIDKVYWVDGLHQVRFINIEHSLENGDLENLIDVPLSTIDMVGQFDLSQPDIIRILSGGVHTAGMIQYAYNLYRLNSSQTRLSPLSELIPLDKESLGGGALNEVVSATPVVRIDDIDIDYTHIKVYAIKYTSYNQLPTISIIEDREVPDSRDIEIFDDGTIITAISLEEFLFLGSDIIVPKHINSKYNRLFLANYEEHNFEVNLDVRAYSFTPSGYCQVFDNIRTALPTELNVNGIYGEKRIIDPNAIFNDPEDKFDSINLAYDIYKYQTDGETFGGEGFYLKYELTQSIEFDPDARYFKDDEIYRLGIEFVNKFGQYSLPKWIADFKAREGNLEGNYNTLSFELKTEFYDWLTDASDFDTEYDIPVGYRVLLAERTVNDKTIIANGIISPMMINDKSDKDVKFPMVAGDLTYIQEKADQIPKLPNILLRNVGPTPVEFNLYFGANTTPLQFSQNLQQMCLYGYDSGLANRNEIQRANEGEDTAGRFYQYNAMYQMYSPELIFNEPIQVSAGLQFRLKGALPNKYNAVWGRTVRENTEVADEGKGLSAVSLQFTPQLIKIIGTGTNTQDIGIICHPAGNEADHISFTSFYRGYGDVDIDDSLNTPVTVDRPFIPPTNKLFYDVYGQPEVSIRSQNATNYNKDINYKYINTFVDMKSDRDGAWAAGGKYGRAIISGNSDITRCLTFVLGENDKDVSYLDRPMMEMLYDSGGFEESNIGLYGELVKSNEQIYLGGIYGGNSWEDKHRTKYIEIGDYKDFGTSIEPNIIGSPGDTFVNYFKFQRVIPKTPVVYSQGVPTWQEIVEFPTETTVDIKNRNDVSQSNWDSRFHYTEAEYQQYNRVYSQVSKLVTQRDLEFNVKKVNSFDTNIIASKEKSAGEIIDSWTDILQNEVMTLDGKHGSINAFVSFNDDIYAIQDKAFTFISITPRVQVQGTDGISIELGTGQVLYQYKYVSTESGTLNKWGVVVSNSGIYYYDALNSAFNAFRGQMVGLSDMKGMHTFFINNVALNDVKMDNPLKHSGISSGYDFVNNDIMFTFYQPSKSNFTVSYNELSDSFVSFYDYLPNMYISKGQFFIAVHPDDTKLYRQFAGNYNEFFDVKYKTSITFNVNPEPFVDCIFDNINFKSEVYLNNVDQPDKTLTAIQAYNDYQDSGLVNLIVGRNNNLRRKFRDWNALIPREGRNRIRAPFIKLKLEFNNANNYKLVLHPMNIFYTV